MVVAATIAVFSAVGCRQDMQDEPKFFPQRGTSFYADGRSVRPQVENTVGRNQLREDSYFYTGLSGGKEGDGMPFPVTMDVLARGQERYNVYCTPCHSRVGNGAGMIVQRGYAHAGNYHTARLETAPLGHFFNVISNGYGAMPDYSAQVTPADRWAIVAYIKALQLSQHATQADVPAGAHVESLSSIAEAEGLPANFATNWVVPSMSPIPEQKTVSPETQPLPAAAQEAAKPVSSNTTAPVTSAPTQAALKTVAAPAAKGSPEAGHEIYTRDCQMCHQPQRTGMPPNIPALVGIVDRVGEDHIRSVVKNGIPAGKPPMPSFPLSATDMDNLIAFLSKADKPKAKPSSAAGSSKSAVMSMASAKR
jgi:mono/diheme cytochrome c family protein